LGGPIGGEDRERDLCYIEYEEENDDDGFFINIIFNLIIKQLLNKWMITIDTHQHNMIVSKMKEVFIKNDRYSTILPIIQNFLEVNKIDIPADIIRSITVFQTKIKTIIDSQNDIEEELGSISL
jgi:hypothetical protein